MAMASKVTATLLSTIISQITIIITILLSSSPFSIPPHPSSSPFFSLLLHLLTSFDIITSLSIPTSKKPRLSSPENPIPPDTRLPNSALFKSCFLMSPSTFEWLSGMLDPLLDCRDPAGARWDLCAGTRLGIGLFRLATGRNYSEVALRFGVSEEAARFCTKQLCRVLCTNFRFWVSFPSSSSTTSSLSCDFESIAGLPNCLGAIDSTRFELFRKEGDVHESIVAQVVADSSCRILNIAIGFHGSKGDSRVLRISSLYKDVEDGILLSAPPVCVKEVAVRQYLVGDNGYPLLPWLMVPYEEAIVGSREEDFNWAHHQMKISVLRAIASFRNWKVLNRPIEEEFRMSVACIGACAILHNVLLMREDFSSIADVFSDCPEIDQNSKYYRDGSLEDCSMKNAEIVRGALAERAREARFGQ